MGYNGWQPTRLRRPWDSPGKNAGVGCHFLFPCMKVKSESEVAQSCLTPIDPMDCSLPGSSVHGIFQAKVLEWGAMAELSSSQTYIFTIWPFSEMFADFCSSSYSIISHLGNYVWPSNWFCC